MGLELEQQGKIERLQHDYVDLYESLKELKSDVKDYQFRLERWQTSHEALVQDLMISQVKFTEQAVARDQLLRDIKDELTQAKSLRTKVYLTLTGGGISLILYFIQSLFQ